MATIFTKKGIPIKVDADDYAALSAFNWYLDDSGYAIGTIRGHRMKMHRLLNQTPKGMSTDHINGDKLDNRKKNLRTCTHAENMQNMRKCRGKSPYKGVYLHSRKKRYSAMITIKGKSTYIGIFDTEIEAAKAYDKRALKEYGEFARINSYERSSPDASVVKEKD